MAAVSLRPPVPAPAPTQAAAVAAAPPPTRASAATSGLGARSASHAGGLSLFETRRTHGQLRRNVVIRSQAPDAATAGKTLAQQALPKLAPLSAPSSHEYNQHMKRQMCNPYEYHHELGVYYTRVHAHIIVGSQPQTPADIDRLRRDEGVRAVLNLQQDRDIDYWAVDLDSITTRCRELGVEHVRRPAADFDPHSLRRELPRMVATIAKAVAEGRTIYVHCTAGLGRAPGAVIAYLFWFAEPQMDLNQAYEHVTALRPCGPKKNAIRGATYDLAKNSPYQPQFEQLPEFAFTGMAQWERDLIRQRVWALA